MKNCILFTTFNAMAFDFDDFHKLVVSEVDTRLNKQNGYSSKPAFEQVVETLTKKLDRVISDYNASRVKEGKNLRCPQYLQVFHAHCGALREEYYGQKFRRASEVKHSTTHSSQKPKGFRELPIKAVAL